MLYIMRGTSCSGKDTLIDSCIKNGRFNETDVLSSDKFRGYLSGSIANQSVTKEAFDMMYEVLDFRLKVNPKITVWNATCLKPKDLMTIVLLCEKHNHFFKVVNIDPPSIDDLKERNQKRFEERGEIKIPEFVFEKHIKSFHEYSSQIETICNRYDQFVGWVSVPQYMIYNSSII